MLRLIRELTLGHFLLKPDDPPAGGGAPTADPPAADPPTEPAATDPPAADPPAADPPAADPPAETITMPKAEADALRRKVAEAEKQKRQAEREAREREEARLTQQGEFEKLAARREQEAAELRAELAATKRKQRVTTIAARLHFIDPEDVIGRLTDDEADDDVLAEAALERIAEQKPYLVDKPTAPKPEIGRVHEPSADAPAPNGNGWPKTADDYDRMTQDELAALPEEEFQHALKVLKAAGKL